MRSSAAAPSRDRPSWLRGGLRHVQILVLLGVQFRIEHQLASIGRPVGKPPPVISSSPRMPVGDFWSDFSLDGVFVFFMKGVSKLEKGDRERILVSKELPLPLRQAQPVPVHDAATTEKLSTRGR